MTFSYQKLWKILEEKNMVREDLRIKTGMSSATMAKLGRNHLVSMEILGKICQVLNCDIADIVEYVGDKA